MMWLTWRQHRRQLLFTGLGLAVLAALMIPTGLAMRHTYTRLGLFCTHDPHPAQTAARTCSDAADQFQNQYNALTLVNVLFLVLPLLVALFWGAPLVAREVEQGTHRLVWTQGVSRRRWALVKFGFVGAATVAAATVYGLGMSWWVAPLANSQSARFGVPFFDMQGVVPIGYTLFAVALGIFAGAIWPRMLPAMATTLAGFLGLRIALTVLARPHYLPARPHPHRPAGRFPGVQRVIRRLGPLRGRPQRRRRPRRTASPGRLRPARRDGLQRPVRLGRLQLAALPARQPVLVLPGHRNRYFRGPRRGPAAPRHPLPPPHRLTVPRPPVGPTNRLLSGGSAVGLLTTADRPRRRTMRTTLMSTQEGLVAYPEDMTCRANTELGDPGACRRR